MYIYIYTLGSYRTQILCGCVGTSIVRTAAALTLISIPLSMKSKSSTIAFEGKSIGIRMILKPTGFESK